MGRYHAKAYAEMPRVKLVGVGEGIEDLRPFLAEFASLSRELLERAMKIAADNQVYRSYIGCGYSDCITPPVILRIFSFSFSIRSRPACRISLRRCSSSWRSPRCSTTTG